MAGIIGGVAAVFGTALSYKGYRDAAKAEDRRAELVQRAGLQEAQYMRVQAGQALAASQREAMEIQRRTKLLESRAIAVAAASGAGASDTTVNNIIQDINGEGAYQAQLALYEGKEQARQLRTGAEIRQFGGDIQAEYGRAAASGHRINAVGSLFSGASTLAGMYGKDKPTPQTYSNVANSGMDFGYN